MTDLATDVINHAAVGVSRIAGRFSSAPKFKAWISFVLGLVDEVEACYQSDDPSAQTFSAANDLYGSILQPDGSSQPRLRGVQLDRLGKILGVSRIVPLSQFVMGLFGFEDQLYVSGFDDDPAGGGRFREQSESFLLSTVLEDVDYWFLLQAKVQANNYDGTLDGERGLYPTIRALLSIGGSPVDFIAQSAGMRVIVNFAAWPTSQQATLLQLPILPKAIGVEYLAFAPLYSYFGNLFGFDDTPPYFSYFIAGFDDPEIFFFGFDDQLSPSWGFADSGVTPYHVGDGRMIEEGENIAPATNTGGSFLEQVF